MRIGRTIPPAASPLSFHDILHGVKGLLHGRSETARFQKELGEFFGVRYCFLVSSGKTALWLILKALHAIHPDRNTVLIPAYTCYSVPSAIESAGLRTMLCDLEFNTLDFDFVQLDEIANQSNSTKQGGAGGNKRTDSMSPPAHAILAVVPTHLFGFPADIAKLKEIVADPAITIVEDAAQAMGGIQGERKLGTLGDAGFFSLGRGKAISTVEGGIVLTNRRELADEIEKIIEVLPEYSRMENLMLFVYAIILALFVHPMLFWLPKSLPFLKLGQTEFDPMFAKKRMSAFQAGLSWGWQEKLRKLIHIRSKSAAHWEEVLSVNPSEACALFDSKGHDGLKASSDKSAIVGPIRFPVLIGNEMTARQLTAIGERQGLGIAATYPESIAGIAEMKARFADQQYPIAKGLSRRVVTLPTHAYCKAHDRARIEHLLMQQPTDCAT